jgi:hypothetical protein
MVRGVCVGSEDGTGHGIVYKMENYRVEGCSSSEMQSCEHLVYDGMPTKGGQGRGVMPREAGYLARRKTTWHAMTGLDGGCQP